jgi:hypothetical protein
MSHLYPTVSAFIPLADLLPQLQNLINQIQFMLLSSDLTLSDQTTSTPKSFPSTFPSYHAFKRFQQAKTWRDQNGSTGLSPIRIRLSSASSSHPFIQYLSHAKVGKLQLDPDAKLRLETY